MKKLLLLLLFPSICSAGDLGQFSIGDANYRLIAESLTDQVSDKNLYLTALWEVTDTGGAFRWKVIASGCDKPIGSVTIIYESAGVRTYDWSWQGSRAYDHMAAAACISYHLPAKKTKGS